MVDGHEKGGVSCVEFRREEGRKEGRKEVDWTSEKDVRRWQ